MFTSTVDPKQTVQLFKDYTLREQEIFQSARTKLAAQAHGKPSGQSAYVKQKLPKRLRGLTVELVRRLQVLHCRCSYVELLEHYCGKIVSLVHHS